MIAPPPFQGVTVEPGSVVVLEVGHFVQLQPFVAVDVETSGGEIVLGGRADRHGRQGPRPGRSPWARPRRAPAGSSAPAPTDGDRRGLRAVQSGRLADHGHGRLAPAGRRRDLSVVVPAHGLATVAPPLNAVRSGSV